MAHVAEAAESSGRVLFVVEHGSGDISAAASVAARFAAAFGAEIESVVFNTDAVLRAMDLPVAAVASMVRAQDDAMVRAGDVLALLDARHRRSIETAARRAGVPVHHTNVSGVALDHIDGLCLARGPWNVVVLSRAVSQATAATINDIFANVSGATGIVVSPTHLAYPDGPIAIVVEDEERLPAMLRAAGRLKGLCGRVHLLVACDLRADAEALEAHVRLTTPAHQGLTIEPLQPMLGIAGAMDEMLRDLKISFCVARSGGALLPGADAMARTIALARAPFLLVR